MKKAKKQKETKPKEPPKDPDKSGPTGPCTKWFRAGQAKFTPPVAAMEPEFKDLAERIKNMIESKVAGPLLQGIGQGISVVDKDMRILWTNQIFADWGWRLEEIQGTHCYKTYNAKDEICDHCPTVRTLKSGKVEKDIQLAGNNRYCELTASPMKDERGRIIAVVEVVEDITELKRTEEKLKESEEHYRIFASYQETVSELRKFYTVDTPFEQMVQKTLDLIIEKFGYYMAWYAELIEEEKVILPKLWAGKYEKYLDGLRLEYESDKRDAKCAMSLAILTKKPFGYVDLEHDKDFEKWRAFALQYGYRSNQAIPFIIDGKCKSAFLIYSTRPRAFSEDLVHYLKGIVDELATIIEKTTESKRLMKKEKELAATIAAEKAKRKAIERSKALLEEKTKKLTDSRTAMIHMLKSLDETSKELAAARDYTDNIIKSVIDTLIVVDPEAKIKTVNQATLGLLGYKEDELIGKPVATIFAEEEEEEEVSIFKGTRLKRLIEEGTIHDYDMKYRTKKGEVVPVSFSGSVMRDKDGNLVGIVGIARDLREIKRLMEKEKKIAAAAAAAETEKKRASELEKAYLELQESRDNLIRSEKLAYTGRIAVGIAHEIRNPLTNVAMSIQQLKKVIKLKYPEVKYPKYIEIIEKSTERANFLITELVNCARPPKLNLELYDVHRVLKYVLESTKTKIGSRKIKIVKKFASKPPKIRIDREQLGRAFLNIVINAIEAMPKGGKLTIITEIRGEAFVAKIQDTGKGIPEEDIIRIFDPFFSSKPGGVGLGLTLCYGVIVGHDGTIEVESKWKRGTTFTVSLPIKG